MVELVGSDRSRKAGFDFGTWKSAAYCKPWEYQGTAKTAVSR